VHTRHASKCFR